MDDATALVECGLSSDSVVPEIFAFVNMSLVIRATVELPMEIYLFSPDSVDCRVVDRNTCVTSRDPMSLFTAVVAIADVRRMYIVST